MCFAHFVGWPVRHCVDGNKCIILLLLCWCHVCCSVCAGVAVNMMRLCQMVAFITICTQTLVCSALWISAGGCLYLN